MKEQGTSFGAAAGWGDISYHLENTMCGYGTMVRSWQTFKPLDKNCGADKGFLEIAKDKLETEDFVSDYKWIYTRK